MNTLNGDMTPFEYPHRRLATDRFSYLHKPVSEKQNGPKKIASTKLWRSFLRAIRKIIPVSRKTFRPSNKTFSLTNTFPFINTSGQLLPGLPGAALGLTLLFLTQNLSGQ